MIHKSDSHYGQAGAVQANALVNNAIVNRPDAAELVVIDTGDDVETPSRRIYATAHDAQVQLVGAVRELVKVPGNHDVITMGAFATSEANALYNRHSILLTGRSGYPQLVIVDDIAIIGLDTNVRPKGSRPWQRSRLFAEGHLGTKQIEECQKLVHEQKADGRRVVIAMHHCPSGGKPTLRLSDRHALGDALEAVGGVDLMLAGHLHRAGEWRDVFGADWLLSSPKTPDAQMYREIWWEDGRLVWEWVKNGQVPSDFASPK